MRSDTGWKPILRYSAAAHANSNGSSSRAEKGGTGQILPLHAFLDIPRRIAQERVPIASNVGSRDVTWVIGGLPDLLQ